MICVIKCAYCKHNRKEKIDNWIPASDAFPNGIPLDFNYGEIEIGKACNPDNNIGFTQRENFPVLE